MPATPDLESCDAVRRVSGRRGGRERQSGKGGRERQSGKGGRSGKSGSGDGDSGETAPVETDGDGQRFLALRGEAPRPSVRTGVLQMICGGGRLVVRWSCAYCCLTCYLAWYGSSDVFMGVCVEEDETREGPGRSD